MLTQKWITVAPWIRKSLAATTGPKVKGYGPSVLLWGAAAGIFVLDIVEVTPLFRREVFAKLPIVGGYWQRKIEASARVD
ncbi:hypothetical protein BC833DRAFT_604853 [Globomyces pollinis-pini]|nr:hypothetical protein BC833DRAFT_604853 [Globomyces pollinis-pini]KAJ2992356.1 hypothetical protein HDV02_003102 [Globomyces sp. JEL0801]